MAKHPVATSATAGMLDVISERLPQLRKSEQKVAALVLDDPARVIHESVAALSKRAQVSEPTVMRFATGMGFEGYQDFKMQLAQSLALGIPVTQSSITEADDTATAVNKIFSYAVTSLAHARDHLDATALEKAASLLAKATEIVFFGVGASSIVALDAQQKFPILNVPCSAPTDQQMMLWAGSLAKPSTAVVAFSNSGRTTSVIEATASAKAQGAATIAIVGATGPLSEIVDAAIVVETFENTDFYTPTTSRLAALTAMDALATLVAIRHPDEVKHHGRKAKATIALRLAEDS
ncbi:SIS domain-containing protein [Amycolatopsis sp. NPDC049252]|uniref:SIS domain-containing protein n=1 Tax=Amycolatopsis sp. NPDC049252 TaxID=3363933 RepID=UPI00371B0A3A